MKEVKALESKTDSLLLKARNRVEQLNIPDEAKGEIGSLIVAIACVAFVAIQLEDMEEALKVAEEVLDV